MKQILVFTGIVLLLFQNGNLTAKAQTESVTPVSIVQIADRHLANRLVFNSGLCRFTLRRWEAISLEEAKLGIINGEIETSITYELFLKDSDHFTLKSTRGLRDGGEKSEEQTRRFEAIHVAVKEGYALDFDTSLGASIVYAPQGMKVNVRYHPMNFSNDSAGLDPASLFGYARAHNGPNNSNCLVLGTESISGEQCTIMQYKYPGDSHYVIFYIDMDRGAIPLLSKYFRMSNDTLTSISMVTNIEKKGSCFVPTRSLKCSLKDLGNEKGGADVYETIVDNYDPGYRVTEQDMSLQLPKSAQFSDGVNVNTYKTLFRNNTSETVSITTDEIEGIYDQLQKIAVSRESDAASSLRMHEEITSKERPLWIYLVISNIVVIAIAIMYFRKKQSN